MLHTLAHIIENVFLSVGLLYTVHIALYVIFANIYDMQKHAIEQSARQSARFHNPLVSVIIPAFNEELGILRTLKSVSESTYDNLQVIVVNDGSGDLTAHKVRSFIADLSQKTTKSRFEYYTDFIPKRRIWSRLEKPQTNKRYYYIQQTNQGKAHALNNALQNCAYGELVMTLDGDSTIDRHAIEKSVEYFKDSSIAGVASNVRITGKMNAIGVLQKFEHLIGYRSKKLYTVLNCEFIVGGVASMYRKSVISNLGFYDTDTQTEDIGLSMKVVASGNISNRIVYGSDVVAYSGGVLTLKALYKQRLRWKIGGLQNLLKYSSMLFSISRKHSKSFTWYRLPMAFLGELLLLLQPIFMMYLLVTCVIHRSFFIFVGAYIMITGYTLINVWFDEHLSFKQKTYLSLYAPIVYILFQVMEVVQIMSLYKSFSDPKRLLRRTLQDSRWQSPERTSEQLAFV